MMVNGQSNPNDEVVKCVIVGDSGVGKTCLVCAWACNTHYDLKKLVKTHVATVWAIDHYQRDREVLERSWCEVDGVRVSLRLWDTFGYHDKDRRFAYRGADVILLCFSTVRPSSLHHVKTVWYPEIRHFCPTTPIVLAGTQADLRYLYNDDEYVKIEKGLMYRKISEADIITPAVGHETAKDIGAPFYESSVLTKFGVSDIFINCVRAALIERRKLKFWNTQLRRVQRPLIQHPMPIPTPGLPSITVVPPSPCPGLFSMLYDHSEYDVLFVVRGVPLEAHRVILAVSCQMFENLFSCEGLCRIPVRLHEVRHIEPLQDHFHMQSVTSDSECLLDDVSGQAATAGTGVSILDSPDPCASPSEPSPVVFPHTVFYTHPAIEAMEVKLNIDPFCAERTRVQTVVTLHSDITVRAFQLVLEFLYSGRVCQLKDAGSVKEVRRTAELLGLDELLVGLDSFASDEMYLCAEVEKQFVDSRQARLRTLALNYDNFLTDVLFEVDDGQVGAHKVLLMAGCEMMYAMFSNHFIESSADVVSFSGINCNTFRALKEYIYTGEVTSLAVSDCLALIVTANRLCLPRLVSLAEAFIVAELQSKDRKTSESVEEAALILEPCELHNAKQLAKWCEKFLCIHYQDLTQLHGKLFRSLCKEHQEVIERHRWPPVWHLKEMERYEHQTHDRISHPAQQQRQDYNRCFSGCLCFSRRAHHYLNDPVDLPI